MALTFASVARRDGESLPLAGVLAAMVTVAGWTVWTLGTRHAVAHPGAYGFDPVTLATIRFGFAALVFAPVWLRMGLKPKSLSWRRLALLLGSGVPFAAVVVLGFQRAPASDAGPLVTSVLPLFTAIASAVFLKERISRGRMAGLALIALGVAGILLHGIAAGTIFGHLLFLLGALLWTGYAMAFRLSGLKPIEAAAIVAIWSSLMILPLGLPRLIETAAVLPASVLLTQVFVQGVISGVMSILAYTLAVKHLGPSKATAATAIAPVAIGLAAVPVLGESITLFSAISLTLTTIGVFFASGAVKVPGFGASTG